MKCDECDPNEQGYCTQCGHVGHVDTAEPKTVEPFHLNGKWPTNTWLQKRRLKVAIQEATNHETT